MVCTCCKGLQKHIQGLDFTQGTDPQSVRILHTTLPALRTSSTGCRACALLLNGILLHHDKFKNQKEEDVWITAYSFTGIPGKAAQDHLSVEIRWKPSEDQDECQDDEHDLEHTNGYPDLKLEYFTDGGALKLFDCE